MQAFASRSWRRLFSGRRGVEWIRQASTAKPIDAVEPQLLGQSRSPLGLGIATYFASPPALRSIRNLPEVELALESNDIDSIRRAVDVFSGIQPGGLEHLACLALKAEMEPLQATLDEIHDLCKGKVDPQRIVQLSKAKLGWMEGDFELARSVTSNLVEDLENSRKPGIALHAARTGLGISRISGMENIDDAFSVRDPFRQVVAHVKRCGTPEQAAMAYLNLGTAEAMYAASVSRFNDVEVPLNSAMVAWKNGLTQLKGSRKHVFVQAQLHSNMAWGMLMMTKERDYLDRAKNYANDALKCMNQSETKYGLDRTLCLVGTCSHKLGDPVTAEGLFASALDTAKSTPTVLGRMTEIEVLRRYADLCRDWDKRDKDALAMEQQIETVEQQLPTAWRRKKFIDGSLWFWLP